MNWTCPMCGSKNSTKTYQHNYKYDNDETFVTWVCEKCHLMHNKLTGVK